MKSLRRLATANWAACGNVGFVARSLALALLWKFPHGHGKWWGPWIRRYIRSSWESWSWCCNKGSRFEELSPRSHQLSCLHYSNMCFSNWCMGMMGMMFLDSLCFFWSWTKERSIYLYTLLISIPSNDIGFIQTYDPMVFIRISTKSVGDVFSWRPVASRRDGDNVSCMARCRRTERTQAGGPLYHRTWKIVVT